MHTYNTHTLSMEGHIHVSKPGCSSNINKKNSLLHQQPVFLPDFIHLLQFEKKIRYIILQQSGSMLIYEFTDVTDPEWIQMFAKRQLVPHWVETFPLQRLRLARKYAKKSELSPGVKRLCNLAEINLKFEYTSKNCCAK